MTQVLVTGDAGLVGRQTATRLRSAGHLVVGFDLTRGQDVRDAAVVASAVRGCEVVVHLAAADLPSMAVDIVDTILMGTKNVVDAAAANGVRRVIMVSSAEVLGIFLGESAPDYLPLDDLHPERPVTPYGAAKLAAERCAQRVTLASDLEVICLRPPGVCDDETMAWIRRQRDQRPSFEWDPLWEYGAWIHVTDLADALVAATVCPSPIDRFASHLVAALDINSDDYPAADLVARVLPQVDWRGGPEYAMEPYRSLLVTDSVQALLQWHPQITWKR
jgi:UDP-glucose 4-epimerase